MKKKYYKLVSKKFIHEGMVIHLSDLKLIEENTKKSLSNLLNKFPSKARHDIHEGEELDSKKLISIKIAIVISCRLGSSRLKNKALLKLRGMTSIERCINQVKKSAVKKIILASSDKENNGILEKIATRNNIKFFRGSDQNLILRNLQTAKKYKLDHIVRVTGDSPVVSFELINLLVNSHINNDSDFTYNENLPLGTRSEVISVNSLANLFSKSDTSRYGEYLSLFYKNNRKKFKLLEVNYNFDDAYKKIRLNLDYETDYIFLNKLFNFYQNNKIIYLNDIKIFLNFFHRENIYIQSKYNESKLFKKILNDSKIK